MSEGIRKVLLATVGTGRTGEDIADMLLDTLKESNPDLTYFLASKKTEKETIPFFEKKNNGQYDYRTVVLENENDLQAIYKLVARLVNEITSQYSLSASDLAVDFTSGTKAMSAGLVLAAISEGIESFIYVAGERDKEGRVMAGGEQRVNARAALILKERELEKAMALFNYRQFSAVINLVQPIEKKIKVPEIHNRAKLLRLFAETYQAWDNFDHKMAVEKVDELGRLKREDEGFASEVEVHKGLSKKIKYASEHLHKLEKESEEKKHSMPILVDIVASAQRRKEAGKYDDAAARLYRALEYAAQLRLDEEHDIDDTGKVPEEKVPPALLEDSNHPLQRKGAYFKLPLMKSYELLQVKFDDSLGKRFMSEKSEVEKHLSKRNDSILAHGVRSLSEEDVDSFYQWLVGFLSDELDSSFGKMVEKIEFYRFP